MKSIKRLKSVLLTIGFLSFLLLTACKDSDNNNTGNADDPEIKGDVTIYVTTNTRSYDFKKQAVDFSDKSNMSPTTITLDTAKRFQTMDGFGAAVTGSTCYNLLKMSLEDRTKFLKETFSTTEGMGYSYIRISIGCSDFSLSEYTCCDNPGIENFALQSEEINQVIPILKEIRLINPEIKILGSPWTSPRWMKVNNLKDLQSYNSWTSGQLNPAYYSDYGTYFVKWIQAFEKEGIPIYAITPQNEPLNRGNSASLFMGWQEQRDFVKNALTPQFKAAGLNTKVYLFDHNYNYDTIDDQNDYPVKIYDAKVDDELVAGAAYHNYGGNRNELIDIHNQYPNKELIFTETSIGTWNDGKNLAVRLMADMEEVALGTINNWCKAVIVWNLMLDTDRGPNREGGCQTCYGAVDIDRSNYKTITRNSHYYIIGHLSSVVKPGAVRIGVKGYSATGITCSAFENPDGTYAFVLLNNTGENKKITLSDEVQHFSYDVPAQSVVSYLWKKHNTTN
jgi:glucosylceramidase